MVRDLVLTRFRHVVPGRRLSPRRRGDDDLNPTMRTDVKDQKFVQAAVLVPLIERPGGMTVLLTKRTDHLHDHAGQISFPGGRIDPEDIDATAAALRETEEETGLNRSYIDIIGRLDTYVTRTGFEVTPVVGLVRPIFTLNPDTFEVAEIFEVPLDFFMASESRRMESREWQGKRRHFYVYSYKDYYIWGATAGMLNNLVEVLTAA